MKLKSVIPHALIASGILLASASLAHAQGFGGGGVGTPGLALPEIDLYSAVVRVPPLDDIERTKISRFEEAFAAELRAARVAQEELVAASLAVPTNAANIRTRAQALATAETALAIARANGWAVLRVELNVNSPDKLAAVISATSSPTGTGTGNAGRGGAPAPAPAAAGRGGRGN
jgi:hypothetical protein